MRGEYTNREAPDGFESSETVAGAPSLPDINAETYPFETVQHLLDEAAYFNLFSVPDPQCSSALSGSAGQPGSVIGFQISEILHRFEVSVRPPNLQTGLSASNVMGESLGRFEHHWMIIPDDFDALPDREPPATAFNPSRSQRFVMLDSICRFDNGKDGFRGFGTGTTYPTIVNGQPQLLAAAVGNILEGFGKFKNHEGTYTYCGSLSPYQGFLGNVLLRVVDPEGALRTEGSLPALQAWPAPDPGATYIIVRGQKKNRYQKTAYNFGPEGQVTGLNVSQQLRLVEIDSVVRERGGMRSTTSIGQVVGNMHAGITFNLLNPGAPGTALAPIPFQSYNEYTFSDRDGANVGTIVADGGEGRTFNLKLVQAPGQQALRFGGFGPIVKGTGRFEGIQGLMTDNSVVGISPHALATLYVLRIHDWGRFRRDVAEGKDSCRRDFERLVDACRNT
jgi:hypothetical protein